jgi:hypothetical protein
MMKKKIKKKMVNLKREKKRKRKKRNTKKRKKKMQNYQMAQEKIHIGISLNGIQKKLIILVPKTILVSVF